MNRVIYWLQNVLVRLIVTTLIVVVMPFLFSGMLGYDNALPAQAKPLTTEYNSAKDKNAEIVNTTDAKDVKEKAQKAAESKRQATREDKERAQTGNNYLKEKIEDVAENVREKLNLDEPLPPSTKKFLNSTENAVDKTVKGTKEGLQDAAEQVTGKPAY